MYSEIIDLLQSSFKLSLLHLIYDILANEIDDVIYFKRDESGKLSPIEDYEF